MGATTMGANCMGATVMGATIVGATSMGATIMDANSGQHTFFVTCTKLSSCGSNLQYRAKQLWVTPPVQTYIKHPPSHV
jgi:hypothetical protein